MTDKNFTLTQEYLKECLEYNPETGDFTWLERPVSHFKNSHVRNVWNTKYAFGAAGYKGKCGIKSKPYCRMKVQGKAYKAHRLAVLYMTGSFPTDQVDHIDGNGLNNKWTNLSLVTIAENCKNQRQRSTNTSGFMGVCWVKSEERWRSRITVDGLSVYLGYFTDFFEACCARKSAENKYGFHPNHGTIRSL